MHPAAKDLILALGLGFFKEWETGLEDDAFYEARDRTVREIMKIGEVPWALSKEDVRDALQEIVQRTRKDLDKIDPAERRAYLTDHLLTESEFIAVYPIYTLYDFPADTRIGQGLVVDFSTLPDDAREMLEMMWESQFRRRPGVFATAEEYVSDRKEGLLLEFRVRACGFGRATEITSEDVDDALNVLRYTYTSDLVARDFVVWAEGRGTRSSTGGGEGWGRYNKILESELKFWTEIITKSNPTDLEERLFRALRLLGLATVRKRPGLSFVLLTIALESLLLVKGDSDYLRQRLAEKVAFLLESDRQRRIDLCETMRKVYDRRSGFVHSGTEHVSEEELSELEAIFWRVIRKIEDLRNQGYVSVAKSGSDKTIDALVETLKFG